MKAPKVLSLRQAERPRYGVLYYAKVQSRATPGSVHFVSIGQRSSACSCPDSVFRRGRREPCDHVKAVRARIAKRVRAS